MRIRKRLALPLTALISLASNAQHAPTPADEAAAARANAEQNQQIQQQRDAQQRDATVQAAAVRSTLPTFEGYPLLPVETPCFRIGRFALDVPTTLPDAERSKGASALSLDPFASAREWLDHYKGQCVGKSGIETLTKGLQQAILSRGYVTTRVLVPQQDLSSGTLAFALVPGVLHQLRFADPETRGTLKSAFPARDGDLLDLGDLPPRQNTCRSNTIDEPGAMMRKRIGKVRTSIQGQSGCTVVAAGERGVGRRCT
jgi:hemolysin activation/secretion protein